MKWDADSQPDFWLPDPPAAGRRFALGRLGATSAEAPRLVMIGMNPSHASDLVSDTTMNRLAAASLHLGYAGWAMLNLYPERASSPKTLSAFDPEVSNANCDTIEWFSTHHGITEVWGAWGDIRHPTIRHAKIDVRHRLASLGIRVFYFGDLTKRGEPRHLTPRGAKLDLTAPKRYLPEARACAPTRASRWPRRHPR